MEGDEHTEKSIPIFLDGRRTCVITNLSLNLQASVTAIDLAEHFGEYQGIFKRSYSGPTTSFLEIYSGQNSKRSKKVICLRMGFQVAQLGKNLPAP